MIYITGDTHIPHDIRKLTTKRFPEQKLLSKTDYVIICGDFGGIWKEGSRSDNYWLEWLHAKPFTTLFVDGNHENFDLLNAYPVERWNGGKVHVVRESILHLMRGQVFEIDGLRFFTMGGASSHDREWRTPGISWWPEELPSQAEQREAKENLARVNYHVDYIITHTAPNSVLSHFPYRDGDELSTFLEEIKQQTTYRKWFFGHMHEDQVLNEKHIALYHRVCDLDRLR